MPVKLDKHAQERIAGLFKGFADTTRVQILSLLMDGEMCVNDIAQSINTIDVIGQQQAQGAREIAGNLGKVTSAADDLKKLM